jgi:hypothetical protein
LVHPSTILLPAPLLLLWLLQQVSMFHIHSYIENTSAIFTLFSLFIYPPPSSDLLLAQPVLHSYPPLFKCLLVVQWEFCLGILPVNIFFYSQSNPPPLLFLTLPSHPVLLKNFSVSSSCSYICISVLFTIFISFCPSHLASSDSPTFRNMFCIYLYVC